MDRAWLTAQLASGRSIESLAREVERPPSTVAYWVKKHGLSSAHADRHAARGGIEPETLSALVEQGLSLRAIAARLGVSYATVRHWMGRYGLQTPRARRLAENAAAQAARPAVGPGTTERVCPIHGLTAFVAYGPAITSAAERCRKERVVARRRRIKAILVAEAGGRCALCGYDRYLGALQFHHLDPGTKSFGLGLRGVARSLERCRAEARKCALLCANCHAEVEGGVAIVR